MLDNIKHVRTRGDGSVRLFDSVFGKDGGLFPSIYVDAVDEYYELTNNRVAVVGLGNVPVAVDPQSGVILQKEIDRVQEEVREFRSTLRDLSARRAHFIFSILGLLFIYLFSGGSSC